MGKFLVACIMLVAFPLCAGAGEITVAGGAGLKDVLNDLGASFVQSNQSVTIIKSIVVSGVLARQLDSGAQIDIVFTANREWMDYLKEKKHVDPATISPFAYNTVVFVGKGLRRVSRLDELTTLNRIAVGSPKSVPAGEYAIEALRNAGLEKQLEGKLVMARDVRESLLYAERGEADGAFVYRTDALLSKEVDIWFTVPQNLYSRVVYMSALTVSGVKKKEAVDFSSYLHSAQAKPFLLKYGFEIQ